MEPALLQTVTHAQEAGERSLERAISGIVHYNAVKWAAHVDKQVLSPSSLPPPLPAPLEVSNAPVKVADGGYKPAVEADELEKTLRPSRYDGEDPGREPRRGVVWGLIVTGMGAGAIILVESIATPGSGHLKLTGSHGEVRPELARPYYP
jgi:ATP-dependent Lon protease